MQTVANFVVSVLALSYLKSEFDDIREVIEEQGELGEGLGADTKHLRKRVSANCQKVKRTSQAFILSCSLFYESVGLVYIQISLLYFLVNQWILLNEIIFYFR